MAKLSLSQLASMFERLATSYEAGINAVTIWKREASTTRPPFQTGIQQVSNSVSSGESVAEGMLRSRIFPETACYMVQVGERSGRLEVVYWQLAEHYENLKDFRRTLLLGIAWPAFELFVAVTLPVLVMFVIGMLVAKPVDYFGFGLSNTGNIMLYCTIVFGFLGTCGLAIFALIRGWFGKTPLKIALRIPLIGDAIQTLALGRMAWSLGMAHEAGMNAIETMELALKSTQLDYYISDTNQISSSIQSGQEMSIALQATGSYPEEFLNTLSTGEISGTISETMGRLSDEYRKRSKTQFTRLSMLGAVLAFAMIGVLIGGVLIYAVMQYTSWITEMASP